jgi:nucleoid DNA-binding protein/LysM repeat protein
MLTIKDIARILISQHKVRTDDAEAFIAQMIEVINEGLISDRQVKIKGFGTFKLQTVKERDSISVSTGERVTIGEHDKVTFTPDSVMRDLINKPFAQFETIIIEDDSLLEEITEPEETIVDNVVTKDTEEVDTPEVPSETIAPSALYSSENEVPSDEKVVVDDSADNVEVVDEVAEKEEEIVETLQQTVIEKETAESIEESVQENIEEVIEEVEEKTIEEEVPAAVPAVAAVVEKEEDEVEEQQIEEKEEIPAAVAAVAAVVEKEDDEVEEQPVEEEKEEEEENEEKEEKEEQPVEEEDEKEEDDDEDEEEEIDDDYDYDEGEHSPMFYGLVSGITCAILFFAIGYYACMNGWLDRWFPRQNVQNVTQQDSVAKQPVQALPADTAVMTDTAKPTEEVAAPKQEKEDVVSMDEYSQKDTRVKTGAWVITGTQTEVTVKAGQTLKSISKAYLGPDMECYVEVYNDKKTVKAGDVIKIPQLKPKKQSKR